MCIEAALQEINRRDIDRQLELGYASVADDLDQASLETHVPDFGVLAGTLADDEDYDTW